MRRTGIHLTCFLLLIALICLSAVALTGCDSGEDPAPTYADGLEYTTHYDGTCTLSGIGTFEGTVLRVPEKSPEGDTVVAVGVAAFQNCADLTTVSLPYSVTEIGAYAFAGCTSLSAITLPDRLVTLGDFAFKGCSAADRVYIGPKVTHIGDSAFFGCNGLLGVFYEGSTSDWKRVDLGSGNSALTVGVRWYYYSETPPTTAGYYWHYRGGSISIWE